MSLLHRDPPVVMNVKKIRRLMDKYGLSCPIRKANPYRRMAKALRTSNVADNLLKREFRKYGPRMVLLTDITYLPYNGVFAYLSTYWMHSQSRFWLMLPALHWKLILSWKPWISSSGTMGRS